MVLDVGDSGGLLQQTDRIEDQTAIENHR